MKRNALSFALLTLALTAGLAVTDCSSGSSDENKTEEEACKADVIPMDTPSLTQKKFALSMFHFNMQYVAGGMDTVDDKGNRLVFGDSAMEGWTDDALSDWIIDATFAPVLDLYMRHPTWKATFEMQGMMMEVIAARHPDVLAKLRQGAQSGQIEVVSFHYSDQLFLAFPAYDMEKSFKKNRKIFADAGVPLSGVVFNQEGQAGEGKHAFMANHCYSVSVFPPNLFKYYHHNHVKVPFYKDHGVDVIIGSGLTDEATGIETTWTFFDDGELLAFPLDPYFAPYFYGSDKYIAPYEERLVNLEKDGYKITSVADYVNHLKAQGVAQPDMPRALDGTWQPTSTDSLHRWMGGRSDAPYNNLERDNFIRTSNYKVHKSLQAADILLATAKKAGKKFADEETKLDSAWSALLRAEVSDATGITPWEGEYYYGLNNNNQALKLADEAVDETMKALGWKFAKVDFAANTAVKVDKIEDAPTLQKTTALSEVAVSVTAPTREVTQDWYYVDANTYKYVVAFGKAADTTGKDAPNCAVTVSFQRFEDKFLYTPALMEDAVVEYPFSDFSFQSTEVWLPLSNGLIGLGNNWWVVKDCESVHLAAKLPNETGKSTIEFIDETADPNPADKISWVFYLFKGTKEEALALANSINIAPTVYLTAE